MTRVVLYQSGNRKADFCPIRFLGQPEIGKLPPRVKVSAEAAAAAGGVWKIQEVCPEKGLLCKDTWIPLPHLFICPSKGGKFIKAFIAESELSALARNFEAPPEVLNGAFFMREPRQTLEAGQLSLKPILEELVDPVWKAEFLRWLSGQGPLPTPSRFAWQTRPKGQMSLPGIAYATKCNQAVKKILIGEVALEESPPYRYANFHVGKSDVLSFSITPNSIEHLRKPRQEAEDFDRKKLADLFGNRPGRRIYECSKRAGKKGVGFGSIAGETLLLQSSTATLFETGTLYHFRFIRKNSSTLIIQCHQDRERFYLQGQAAFYLLEGMPSGNTNGITLLPAPPQAMVSNWLAKTKPARWQFPPGTIEALARISTLDEARDFVTSAGLQIKPDVGYANDSIFSVAISVPEILSQISPELIKGKDSSPQVMFSRIDTDVIPLGTVLVNFLLPETDDFSAAKKIFQAYQEIIIALCNKLQALPFACITSHKKENPRHELDHRGFRLFFSPKPEVVHERIFRLLEVREAMFAACKNPETTREQRKALVSACQDLKKCFYQERAIGHSILEDMVIPSYSGSLFNLMQA